MTTPWLAKPSGQCCLEGTLHHGNPRGQFETIGGIETYITKPAAECSNGNIVLYFADVWGMFPNGLLVMDAFADAGYLVLGLDYFRGDPVWKHDRKSPDFDYEAWKQKHIKFADENVPSWIQSVKGLYGRPDTKYACVGYCFGAPYVCNELASGSVNVGAFAHPAFLNEEHFANINKPLFLSCAEVDHTFDTEARRVAIDILRSDGKPYHLQLFSGVKHGFALRCNLENPYEKYVKEQSLKGIIEWFNFWLQQ